MTKDEAIAKVEALNNAGPTWFCPLTKATCNPSCVCYSPAEGVYTYGKNIVYKNHCGNGMFGEFLAEIITENS